ncbi:SAM-dependent methyltransferase [Nakamurella sp. UYEF19]|uniref:class I SAM-dependent methyltransferase n=1 Tax=Nakamurella sp. UYEF19 TaxID=1756392 RepID=UPI0033965638
MEPADFYTGIVAELYGPLKSFTQQASPYVRFIRESGQPALELGCGDGEPLLDLVRDGLDVDGVDSSEDMLVRCRARAAAESLDVTLYRQKMEELDLPRRYRSIFLAGPTFNLLPDDDAARRGLTGIGKHLVDGGTALIPLFVPDPTPTDRLGQIREATAPDGSTLRVSVQSEERDDDARTQRTTLRYERRSDDGATVVERPWILHWHTQPGFRELAADAGLAVVDVRDDDGNGASRDAKEFTFVLQRSD